MLALFGALAALQSRRRLRVDGDAIRYSSWIGDSECPLRELSRVTVESTYSRAGAMDILVFWRGDERAIVVGAASWDRAADRRGKRRSSRQPREWPASILTSFPFSA